MEKKFERSFVLYANEQYYEIVKTCIKSIREYTDIPVIVYFLNSDLKIDIDNVITINWEYKIVEDDKPKYHEAGSNFYINRSNESIFRLLIQRPNIVRDALLNYSETVVYLDSDVIATPYINRIFDLYDTNTTYPYATEGVYEYLFINGRGGAGNKNDMSTTLEHPACELFGVNQQVRQKYRTTNIFIAGQNTIDFLDEWYWMCNHPKVLKDFELYAPFHEETILNVLLWKYKYLKGLPYVYVNGGLKEVDEIYGKNLFCGFDNHIREWVRVPSIKENLLIFHGEKNPEIMNAMIEKIKYHHENKKTKLLFLAPHLSTGGMPGFLLKMIETLNEYHPQFEMYVIEYSNYGDAYSVQKNKIKNIVTTNRYWTLGENKYDLMTIIESIRPDIIHVQEMIEGFDSFNKMPNDLIGQVYRNDRTWRIVETCHNVWFDPKNKMFHPEAYAFCTPYHKQNTFANVPSYGEVIEFPIDDKRVSDEEKLKAKKLLGFDLNKVHVINVGLWTSGKNQKEGIEIARHLQGEGVEFHFIGNQADNFRDYWEPLMLNKPSNVHVWGERSDVDEFMKAADIFMFNSVWECNPLVLREAISHGLKVLARNLPQYLDMFEGYIIKIDDDIENTVSKVRLLTTYSPQYELPKGQDKVFSDSYSELYKKVLSIPIKPQNVNSEITISQHFVNQPFLEVKGDSPHKYTIKFFDEKNVLHYSDTLPSNSWVKLNREYYTKWRAEVWEGDSLVHNEVLDYKDKRVFISISSKSLGDTVAWLPYAKEFQDKHSCKVVVSSFWNHLFKDTYPELEFVEPGSVVNNLHGMYSIGWFYNPNKEPMIPNTIPLQMTASNILGLEYKEIRTKVKYDIGPRPYDEKYVAIATNSTAGCKFWTKEGWQKLIYYLNRMGYKVVNVSKETNLFDEQIRIEDTSIENTMNVIHHSEFFIGLSSGLSWLAWAMNKKVVMISNFTDSKHEFIEDCIRITNPNVCNSCWNNPNFKFDKGDWNWCPINKGTSKQFECHTSITAEMVINQIETLLK